MKLYNKVNFYFLLYEIWILLLNIIVNIIIFEKNIIRDFYVCEYLIVFWKSWNN